MPDGKELYCTRNRPKDNNKIIIRKISDNLGTIMVISTGACKIESIIATCRAELASRGGSLFRGDQDIILQYR